MNDQNNQQGQEDSQNKEARLGEVDGDKVLAFKIGLIKLFGWLLVAQGVVFIPWAIHDLIFNDYWVGLVIWPAISLFSFEIIYLITGIGFIKLKKWSLYTYAISALDTVVGLSLLSYDNIDDSLFQLKRSAPGYDYALHLSKYHSIIIWLVIELVLIVVLSIFVFRMRKHFTD